MRILVAIPVYNEARHVARVLSEVRKHASDILVIDDGSTDDTPLLLARQPVEVVRHSQNRGYGRSMIDAFRWAQCQCCQYDWLVTMDCDEQHEPASLPAFFHAAMKGEHDVVSGTRYPNRVEVPVGDTPPVDRRRINSIITRKINEGLGLNITDAFCGFKAYRVSALEKLELYEPGYAFPVQFWVQAAGHGLRVSELPVPLIYNNPNRTFGEVLDDPDRRLRHYLDVFYREVAQFPGRFAAATASVEALGR